MKRIAVCVSLVALLLAQRSPGQEIPRPEHPTPDAVRAHWLNMNGKWDFRFDADDKGNAEQWFEPGKPGFDRSITVPFPWESELSGIKAVKDAPKIAWYRRTFSVPADFPKDDNVWLHFGAVDYRADVWVNGKPVATHEGGYSPFSANISPALKAEGENTVVVRAFDPTDPSLPTGKQVGWYTTVSGIWQTVWLEAIPKASLGSFTIRTTLEPPQAEFTFATAQIKDAETLRLVVRSEDPTVGMVEHPLKGDSTTIKLPIRDPKPWGPESPHLYDITLELKSADGKVLDSIKTYFGLRTIARGKLPGDDFERIFLNGKPIFLRGALDQSFNPKGIYTAPTDEFLKKDIELAKAAGTNFLRIHIKPDEPRRLYWADKLGMLIMEDMPNTWAQNDVARKSWEAGMRETIARDKNHPSIFAWIDFNETWGLVTGYDSAKYKTDKDTQTWVKAMVALTRQLDPTRLVEDNSPCNNDHVDGSDLNSWHFYIDDHAETRRHIEQVVQDSKPGSSFNYVPGEKMNSAPLINSEYGSVAAGSGDRDVSWGFRDMTTQLRRHPKIQGYIYTELSDIEWEHNGFYDYDRSKKEFGYDAFVPGMTPADLQGADFVGFDTQPAIEAKVGELIRIPLFVSHYSELKDAPKLRWSVTGVNEKGERGEKTDVRDAEWTPYSVKEQKPLGFRIHEPFVGAVGLVLEDSSGKKLAANFVNLVVTPEKPAPRVERLDDHTVAIRFAPGDFSKAKWSGGDEELTGKVWGRGAGAFEYRMKLPESIVKAKPKAVTVLIEAGSKNGLDQVDWKERPNAQDNPQTDARKALSALEVGLDDQKLFAVKLDDDPADARGVLSHLRKIEHGSYGQIIRQKAEIPASVREAIAAGKPINLRFAVPESGDAANGLSLYGVEAGGYPIEPTLIIEAEDHLPTDLGVKPETPITIDTLASKKVATLAAGDSRLGPPATWAYTTDEPATNWLESSFDDTMWKRGPGGFGTPNTAALKEHTRWDSKSIWMRTTVEMPPIGADDTIALHMFHDEDVDIFVNGKPLFAAKGFITAYQDIKLDAAAKALFQTGKNTIAVRCRQTGGGQGIDLGLALQKRD